MKKTRGGSARGPMDLGVLKLEGKKRNQREDRIPVKMGSCRRVESEKENIQLVIKS